MEAPPVNALTRTRAARRRPADGGATGAQPKLCRASQCRHDAHGGVRQYYGEDTVDNGGHTFADRQQTARRPLSARGTPMHSDLRPTRVATALNGGAIRLRGSDHMMRSVGGPPRSQYRLGTITLGLHRQRRAEPRRNTAGLTADRSRGRARAPSVTTDQPARHGGPRHHDGGTSYRRIR